VEGDEKGAEEEHVGTVEEFNQGVDLEDAPVSFLMW
jgi:hypothetical protein